MSRQTELFLKRTKDNKHKSFGIKVLVLFEGQIIVGKDCNYVVTCLVYNIVLDIYQAYASERIVDIPLTEKNWEKPTTSKVIATRVDKGFVNGKSIYHDEDMSSW